MQDMKTKHFDNYKYKKTKVDGYATLIRKALEQKGKYNESLEITIHMLASSLTRYAEIRTALDDDDLVVKTLSRENNAKYSINPLFVMQEHMGEQIRKYLRELRLTNAGASSEEEEGSSNELGKLYEAIQGGSNNGPHLLRPVKSSSK